MLVLARKIGEELVIGENAEIVIRVISQQGEQTRLGIEAPIKIPVHRREIFQRIQEEKLTNKAAKKKFFKKTKQGGGK